MKLANLHGEPVRIILKYCFCGRFKHNTLFHMGVSSRRHVNVPLRGMSRALANRGSQIDIPDHVDMKMEM
jgi:hypothetical protein